MLLYITVHLISSAGHSKHFTPVLWLTRQGSLQSRDEFKVITLKFEVCCRTVPIYLRELLPLLWSQPPMAAAFLQTVNLPAKQARCSREEEMIFEGAGYRLWTFFPEEREINSLANFSVNLIFPAEQSSIISSNKVKFYKIIKFFPWQAEKRQREVLHTKRSIHIHTHTALSNRKCFDIAVHEGRYTRAYWDQTTQLQWYFRNRIRGCTTLHQICNEVLTQIFDVLACWPPCVAKRAGILMQSLNKKVTFFLKIFWASLDWGYSLPKRLVVSANNFFLTIASYNMADTFLLPISLQMRKKQDQNGCAYP